MTTLTVDWQAAIRSQTFGAGTAWQNLGAIDGLGYTVPAGTRTTGGTDGSLAGRDRLGSRLLHLPFLVTGTNPANTWANFRTLAVSMRRSSGPDVELDLRWPGCPTSDSTMRFYGRPLGVSAPMPTLKSGYLQTLATFEATDPQGYGPAVVTTGTTGATVTAAHLGDLEADTVRATVAITGNGGTPSLVNTTDNNRFLTMNKTLAGSAVYTIDLRTLEVLLGSSSADADLVSASGFKFHGGINNVLTLSGAASLSVSAQPAYWT